MAEEQDESIVDEAIKEAEDEEQEEPVKKNTNVKHANGPLVLLGINIILILFIFVREYFNLRFISLGVRGMVFLSLLILIPLTVIILLVFGILMFKRNDTRTFLAWFYLAAGIIIILVGISLFIYANFFVKTQFGQPVVLPGGIRGEIVEKIRQSGDLLVFSKNTIDAEIGRPINFYVGIRNNENEKKCFRTYIECLKALKGECDHTQPNVSIAVGGIDNLGNTYTLDNKWFELFDEMNVEGGDVGVYPVNLQIPGKVSPDTYLMSYEVYKSESGTCGSNAVWSNTPYQEKQFYITVR